MFRNIFQRISLRVQQPSFSKYHNDLSLIYNPSSSFSTTQPPANSFTTTEKFADLQLSAYLKQTLSQKSIEYLTPAQKLALPKLLQGGNALLQAESGSCKSLCYLLPILNSLLSKNKSSSSASSKIKGALILAPTKELCTQIYAFFRALDPENKINITRLGSLTHFAPVVPHLDQKNSEEFLRDISFQNVVNTVSWGEIDILVTTPGQLEDIMAVKDKKDPYNLNPKIVVVDEYDILLGEETLGKSTRSILRRFAGVYKSIFADVNRQRQFILCGSSSVRRSNSSITVEEELRDTFQDFEILQSERFGKLPQNLKYEYVDVYRGSPAEWELMTLKDTVEQSSAKQILIFCNSGDRVRQVYDYLTKAGISTSTFYGNMPTEERIHVLAKFKRENVRVLVASELASRGINFETVDHVIQFDFGLSASSVLHRAGRTGRCGTSGVFTSFVRDKDSALVSRVKTAVANDESLEGTPSGIKRNMRRKETKRIDEGEEQDL